MAWLEILRAVDRPDRLEFAVLVDGASFGASPRCLRRGVFVAASFAEGRGFEGRVDSVSLRTDLQFGRHIVVSALTPYHFLRVPSTLVYRQVTDADVAERVARELELVPVVEASSRLHQQLRREGDPLCFLRRRAWAAKRHLAVTAGRLYLTRELPAGEPTELRAHAAELVSFECMARGAEAHVGGEFVVRGARSADPLAVLTLVDFGSAVDGPYRLVRSRQRIDPEGCTTTGWFLQRGLSYTDWLGRVPA